ncbi:hypothetical protein HD597_003143 [Nonomuraea thailandensis]|uniref:Uncharacterized protein n=1 Tax=Nonomuraea thailandensis TaxID=1188745 RepID=A0A9X2K0P3_9ACTN|nr:hypothetical protein [Nonomuraea thailandensis]MCP2356123.1 hypothetical protein [Nonomuraea thailandensis]
MKKSLIATGGALLAAAMLFGTAGSASAGDEKDYAWAEEWAKRPKHCGLGLNDDTTYHHITKHGVFAGTRDSDVCKKSDSKDWSDDEGDDDYGYDD